MPKKKNTRASNGMGSIRQRADGRWEGRYTAPDGRQHSLYGKTEKDVTAKLRGALHDLDSGAWREPSKLTVAEWMEIWLKDFQSHTSQRTVKIYSDLSRLHIVPIIGHIKMRTLSSMHVRRVISAMSDKKLSANYIHHCHGVMSGAFNAAIEAGVIKTNPARGVKTPRVVKKKLTIVDRDNIPAFIDATEGMEIGNALVFILLTGLRAGEMRGLQWHDIDDRQMHVERQYVGRGGVGFIPPKDGSVRTIELPPEAIDILKRQKKHLAEMRLAAGEKWIDDDVTKDLVFRTARGWFIAESVLHYAVREVGEKIGLPTLHPHDLRHSYAVAALRSGIDVKTVQYNLGHKNASVTLDVYAEYTTDAGKVGAEKLSDYWQNALKK